MKHLIIKVMSILLLILMMFSSTFASWEDAKRSLLSLPSWTQLVEKIDRAAEKIRSLKKDTPDSFEKIQDKVIIIYEKHKGKSAKNSQKIIMILDYLQLQISTEVLPRESWILKRIQKIQSDVYKQQARKRSEHTKVK